MDLANLLAAVAALASATAAWLIYKRDWSAEKEVIEPECYWVGYGFGGSRRPAFAFPLHLANRRGTSSIQGDFMLRVKHVDTGRAFWLQPEFQASLEAATGTVWRDVRVFAPIAVKGRETTTQIVVAMHRGSCCDPDEVQWWGGKYRVTAYHVDGGHTLFETDFELDSDVRADASLLPVGLFWNLRLTPRRWTSQTLAKRDRIMRRIPSLH